MKIKRAAVSPGEMYDEVTGKKIHDDGIDDKKIYTGTKADGSDRKYIGQKGDFRDVTDAFNKQLDKTTSFFEGQDVKFSAAESTIGAGWVGKLSRRLSFFREQVTDGGPFDIKQPGKGFGQVEIGNY